MSVPQMAERCTLMRTSLWPTDGSGHILHPDPGFRTSLDQRFHRLSLMNDAELAARATERLDHLIELRRGMRGAQLSANSRLSMGHDRKGERDDVDALGLHALREPHRERGLAEHDGNDGVLAGKQIEPQALHVLAKIPGVRMHPLAQFGANSRADRAPAASPAATGGAMLFENK